MAHLRDPADQPVRPWRPLLAGSDADRAAEAIEDVAAALQNLPDDWPEKNSLPGGYPGMALFYAYRALGSGTDLDEDRAVAFLERSMDGLSEMGTMPALHGGFTGVAWVLEHLAGRILDPDDDVGLSAVDEALRAALDDFHATHPTLQGNYDLISGLTGLGVYAVERMPRPEAADIVELVVRRLDEMSEERPEGITWFTPPEMIPPNQEKDAPQGYYNFGLAHGVPGIIGFLGAACAAGAGGDRTWPLLTGAVSWLLANENPEGTVSRFPTWRGPGVEGWDHSRLGWCYGDPGVGSALLGAGLAAGEERWVAKAGEVAAHAASLRPEIPESMDGGLCHGTAGLAMIFNRVYQITGDAALREGALFWLEKTLALRRPDRGIAGFQALGPDPDEKLVWQDDPGLLTGAAGIGLVLLAATSSVEPEWDRALLLPALPRSG